MIYLIDDKISRQNDYNWDQERLNRYNIKAISSVSLLAELEPEIFSSNGNIILFHESFYSSSDTQIGQIVDSFKTKLKNHEGINPIAYFSGSKSSRWIDDNGKICMMPPDILYNNLSVFVQNCIDGNINFKFLLFGEKWETESDLRQRIETVNNRDFNKEDLDISKKIFFASTMNYICDCHFNGADIKRNWDFYAQDISDKAIDTLVKEWFSGKEYGAIFIPLCFGQTLSDFMGLRLAMHIRLTNTVCQYKPIYIYGEVSLEEISHNDCFDVLKFAGIYLTHCDYESMAKALENSIVISEEQYEKDLKGIHLEIPTNIGDNHSVANQWAVFRWKDMLELDCSELETLETDFSSSLYYKYLIARFGKNDKFYKSENNLTVNISESAGKNILLIDDEANKGWSVVLKKLLPNSSFEKYDKPATDYDSLPEEQRSKIERGYYDLIFLDLRMNGISEEEITNTEEFSGMKILRKIKEHNKGIQVIMFTASNKAWNMKALLDAGANGYYIKESPDYAFPINYSLSNANELQRSIKQCFSNGYLRKVYLKINRIKNLISSSNCFEDKTEEVLASIDIAYSLLEKSYDKDEYKAYAYLQLFLSIEGYVNLTNVFEELDSGLYLYNGEKSYRILKDKVNDGKWHIYDSVISMQDGGHFSLVRNKYKCRYLETNFLVSALLIFKFGENNSATHNWTKLYTLRNNCAHPKKAAITQNSIHQILDFMLYFFDGGNVKWRNPNQAFPAISQADHLKMLIEKFNTVDKH